MVFRVTLLGTGSPIPDPERFGPCTLIEAGSRRILVDAGRGATIRLSQCGVAIGSIDTILLTHFHSDHVVGLPDLWLTGWLPGPFGRRERPLRIIGPQGTVHLVHHLQEAYAADKRIRIEDQCLSEIGARIQAEEFLNDCVVLDDGHVSVTAFEVDHGEAIKPAFGFRFDCGGKSAVVSGDTRPCENLVRNAQGVDLLIHEIAMAAPGSTNKPEVERVLAHHSSPEDLADVLSRIQPGLAVLTHLVLLGGGVTPQDAECMVRSRYTGKLQLGADLMSIDLENQCRIS